MTLYLDSSALVKLHVDESHSELVWDLVAGALAHGEAQRIVEDLNADWARISLVTPDLRLAHAAGELAARHGIRGFDAVHLAAALSVGLVSDPLSFVVFDKGLARAARDAGVAVVDGAGP